MKHTALLVLATTFVVQAQDTLEEPDRPWSATLQILRPVGTDNPLEGNLDIARSIDVSTAQADISLYPGIAGAVGTSDLDTTWSVTPRLGIGWDRDDISVFVAGNSQIRSWDSTDYALSASLGYQLTSSTSLGFASGTSLLAGEWARTSVDWNGHAGNWGAGASLGIGYLWDVEVTSQAKGKRADLVRTTTADQWQSTQALQVSHRLGELSASLHLDSDLRTYESTRSGGKGRMTSSTTRTGWAWTATLDPWAGLGWSRDAWGVDLSGGWSQPLGTGATDAGAWASLSSSFSW
ncbi:MAG: hypothetical protein RL318_1716 [Fibrobacterota bacterium]|jgi:hypothetical protein